ncbi:MAG: hypothetical protein PHO41_10730 [Eubacteriales bacterium]|nr:hypothetical protein [Eubacteriales bacterium]
MYYSRDGHTQMVAQQLAKRFHADIQRLADLKKRTGPVGALSAGKDALAGNTTVIAPLDCDPLDYDLILLGTPSWFSNVTPAVRAFVAKYNISHKRIGLFGTAHLTGVARCLQGLADLISKEKGGNFPRLALVHRDLKTEVLSGKIDAFYAQVMGDK